MTHLILKDMVKVKGQISEMAVLVVDEDEGIATLACSFFNELSNKVRSEGACERSRAGASEGRACLLKSVSAQYLEFIYLCHKYS